MYLLMQTIPDHHCRPCMVFHLATAFRSSATLKNTPYMMWRRLKRTLVLQGQNRSRQGDADTTQTLAFVADNSGSTAGQGAAVAGSLATACVLAQD